jgi:hypothetical protein
LGTGLYDAGDQVTSDSAAWSSVPALTAEARLIARNRARGGHGEDRNGRLGKNLAEAINLGGRAGPGCP